MTETVVQQVELTPHDLYKLVLGKPVNSGGVCITLTELDRLHGLLEFMEKTDAQMGQQHGRSYEREWWNP